MMKGIIIAFCAAVMLTACTGKQSRIVSDCLVDNVIMGGVLCEPVSKPAVLHAFDQAGMFDVEAEKYSYSSESNLMIVPSTDDGISYGGCSWDYVDYCKDASGNLYAVVFENFYGTRNQAEAQYKKIAVLMEAKHGEANISKSNRSCTSMWTDDTNSVGISIHKDGDDDARGKWTCTFYYVNIALSRSL